MPEFSLRSIYFSIVKKNILDSILNLQPHQHLMGSPLTHIASFHQVLCYLVK